MGCWKCTYFFHRLIITLCLDFIQIFKKIQISVLSTEMYSAVYFTGKCFNKRRRDWKWSAIIACTDQSICDWQLVWDLAWDSADPQIVDWKVLFSCHYHLPWHSVLSTTNQQGMKCIEDCYDIFRTGLEPKFDPIFWMVRGLRSLKIVCLFCSWHWVSSTS